MSNQALQAILDTTYVQQHLINKKDTISVPITACVIALGSNYKAIKNLQTARTLLSQLTKNTIWSTPFQNPDYTATLQTPKPDYTNQCGILWFNKGCKAGSTDGKQHELMTLSLLTVNSKRMEQICKRRTSTSHNKLCHKKADEKDSSATHLKANRVSIDIDILAVQIGNSWQIIEQRYPFKAHEIVGIEELIQSL